MRTSDRCDWKKISLVLALLVAPLEAAHAVQVVVSLDELAIQTEAGTFEGPSSFRGLRDLRVRGDLQPGGAEASFVENYAFDGHIKSYQVFDAIGDFFQRTVLRTGELDGVSFQFLETFNIWNPAQCGDAPDCDDVLQFWAVSRGPVVVAVPDVGTFEVDGEPSRGVFMEAGALSDGDFAQFLPVTYTIRMLSSVPEPPACALVALGLFVVWRRRSPRALS